MWSMWVFHLSNSVINQFIILVASVMIFQSRAGPRYWIVSKSPSTVPWEIYVRLIFGESVPCWHICGVKNPLLHATIIVLYKLRKVLLRVLNSWLNTWSRKARKFNPVKISHCTVLELYVCDILVLSISQYQYLANQCTVHKTIGYFRLWMQSLCLLLLCHIQTYLVEWKEHF